MKTFNKHIKTLLFTIACIICLGYSAYALPPVTWTNGSGDGKWSTASNWSTHTVPPSGRDVMIASSSGETVTMDTTTEVVNLNLQGNVTLQFVSGHNLTIVNSINFLENSGQYPTLNVTDNDTLKVGYDLYTDSYGELYLNSGIFITGGALTSDIYTDFSNGTLVFNGLGYTQDAVGFSNVKNLMIDNTDGVTMNNDISISGNLTGTGALYTNYCWLYIQGDINLDHFDQSNGNVYLWGTTVQHINCPAFFNLICANDSGVILTGNTVVENQLVFDPTSMTSYSGPSCLHLNGFDLLMGSSSSFSGAGSDHGYIISEGGYVNMDVNGTSLGFPMGTAEGIYTPAILSCGFNTNFTVAVSPGTSDKNLNAITDHALNATWEISPYTDAWDFSAEFIYDTSTLELTGFDRTNFYFYTRDDQSTPTPWSIMASGSASSLGGGQFSVTIPPMILVSNVTHYISVGDLNSSLPVELISFNAHADKDKNILDWKTATEINNDHFEIQRSVDAKNWTPIGDMPGHGTTNTEEFYSFVDASANALASSVVYYRLKQVDNNGKFEYSEIRKISTSQTENYFKLYPNPAKDMLNISFNGTENRTVRIFNMNGECVYTSLNEYTQKQIDISSLTSGMYILKVYSATEVNAQVFCKE